MSHLNGNSHSTAKPNGADVIKTKRQPRKPKADGVKRESQATALVNLVLKSCELVHDKNSDVYAVDRVTGEVRHVERKAFRNWLTATYYKTAKRAAGSQAFTEAVQTIAGIGRHDCEQRAVHIRCATVDGSYAIDLGQPGNSVSIVVKPGRWDVVSYAGVMFVRPESLQPLPMPVGGSDISALWEHVNIPERDRLLVLTWLLDCLRPDTPFPLLELFGEQGSAKSVTQSLLRALIDPSTIALRSQPKTFEDVYVGAANGWLLAYDNISHLSPELQDTLCRVSTGVAHATRKLHTNLEESSICAQRPVSINGIGAAVTAQDLVDRTLSVEPPPIAERRERGLIDAAFNEAHSQLLGALLDLFAAALAKLPWIEIPAAQRPRMIEFAKLGCAVAEAMGKPQEEFLDAYETSRHESITRTLDASPVATALVDWLEADATRYGDNKIKTLFGVLEGHRPLNGEAWPRTAHGFANALRRAAPALRIMGIEVSRGRKSDGQTVVTIKKIQTKSLKSLKSLDAGEVTAPGTAGQCTEIPSSSKA
jgi:hypothetical protein